MSWPATLRWCGALSLLLMAGSPPQAIAAPSAGRTTLRVYAAASLVDAFEELGHVLERRRPGLQVRMNFAGSQQLASQLVQGGRADVFASADAMWMQDVKAHGLLERDPKQFAAQRPGFQA